MIATPKRIWHKVQHLGDSFKITDENGNVTIRKLKKIEPLFFIDDDQTRHEFFKGDEMWSYKGGYEHLLEDE